MKTIKVSDEDYETLMELSKELQTQDNHHQAFPYFWEPASERLVVNIHNEGEVTKLVEDCEASTPEDYAEDRPELYEAFLREEGAPMTTSGESQAYAPDLEWEWIEYALDKNSSLEEFSEDWEQKTEHNPSLFLSDVQGYIKSNAHHLGRRPHTYARTVQRMPKMKRLIAAIYRLNKQPRQTVNHEAERFVYPGGQNERI
jgi:hypothetical protein